MIPLIKRNWIKEKVLSIDSTFLKLYGFLLFQRWKLKLFFFSKQLQKVLCESGVDFSSEKLNMFYEYSWGSKT